jgi:hypothetical protein
VLGSNVDIFAFKEMFGHPYQKFGSFGTSFDFIILIKFGGYKRAKVFETMGEIICVGCWEG